jgi:hypothetical protein
MDFLQRLLSHLPRWRRQRDALPPYVSVLDVRTEGPGTSSTITGLVVLRLENDPVSGPTGSFDLIHLAFDTPQEATPCIVDSPGRGSTGADTFARQAAAIWKIMHRAPLIVAPNAARVVSCLDLAFTRVGIPPINRPAFCTVQGPAQFRGSIAPWPALPQSHPEILQSVWDAAHPYYRLQGYRISFEPSDDLGLLPHNRRAAEAASTVGAATSPERDRPDLRQPHRVDGRQRQRSKTTSR